jgi:hypothetical protein
MKTYTKEDIVKNINLFIEKYGYEPSSHDFTNENNLPNKKTIERRFGGLRKLREELGLYVDHRIGKKRSNTANEINKRAIKWNSIIYKKLLTIFDEKLIHRESSIFDDRRNRTDFKVYANKTFLVDIFYPKNRQSLLGCVLLKQKKYPTDLRKYLDKNFDKVIFLNLNDKVENTIPLSVQSNFSLMNLNEFWQYCKSMV